MNSKVNLVSLVPFIVVISLLSVACEAAIPLQINHQGFIDVGGTAFNGNGDFRFSLVDPDSGNNVWTNDGTNVGTSLTPTNAVSLAVINGIYNVRLGDTTLLNMTSIPSMVFDDQNLVLRIWFDDGTNGNEQLIPDQPLTSVGYAYHALTAETAGNGVPSGRLILDSTSTPPPGWTYIDAVLQSDSQEWRTRTGMKTKRFEFGVGVWNDQIYAIGGSTGEETGPIVGTNEAYDPLLNSWISYATMTTPRSRLAIGVVNDKIYAMGGGFSNPSFSHNEEYDPVTDTWAPKAPLPQPRSGAAVAVWNGRIYLLGGTDGPSPMSTNLIYNPLDGSQGTWTVGAPMPAAVQFPAVGVVDNRIYVIGGNNGNREVDTVYEYDPMGNSWTTKEPMPTARYHHAVAVVGQAIYALGGKNDSNPLLAENTVEKFIPSQNAWYTTTGMLERRRNLGAGVVGGRIHAFGGIYDSVIGNNEEYTPPNVYYLHRKD
jgi:N-acetylneuraminic acid mutarotase